MINLWFDMGVIILSVLATAMVGMYFSKAGRLSLKEYMLGSQKMTVLPISLSIAATYLTGSSMVTTSQEVYMYGFQPALVALCYVANGIWLSWVYLPVSYSIKSASSFEFFDRRFNNRIRKYASLIYTFETLHHTAISQLIPALALSQDHVHPDQTIIVLLFVFNIWIHFSASDLPAFPIACALSFICFIYTASGGLKAVACADGVQAIIFMMATVVLFFVGVVLVGGPSEVWQKAIEGSRVEFWNFDLSFDVRYSATAILLGSLLLAPNLYLTPSFHQRIAAMPTFEKARQVSIWSSIFSGVFLFFSYSMGLVIYSYFAGCDPVLARKGIQNYQSILSYFAEEVSYRVPGIMGLLLSGIIAAGLSTTTSCWNTVACTIYEDLVAPYLKPNVSKKTSFNILNAIVFLVAVITTGLIPFIQGMRSLFEATLALKSFSTSIYLILYNAGMFLPWVNSIGAFVGSVISGLIAIYVAIGTQRAKSQHLVVDYSKILTTSQCVVNGTTMEALNLTRTIGTEGYGVITKVDPSVHWLHKLGMFYFMLPGTVVGMLVAYLVSIMTGAQNRETVDREMIVPQMRWVLPSKSEKKVVPRINENGEDDVPKMEYIAIAQMDIVE